ncbi:MAG: DUF58 domain-containing protein [Cyclobacteriaceae bacterium]
MLQIDPSILANIKSFDWAIKSLANGAYHGTRFSRKLGPGIEFSQYRPYSQGDDLRQLDWKMYARSEKYFIKQSQIETNVNITFLIDTSNSMTYEEDGWSKLNYAKLLTGVLCHLSMDHGDSINISTSQDHVHGQNKRHWSRILYVLSELQPTDRFETPVIDPSRGKELFVIISDLYEQNKEWSDFISGLKSPKNEVIVFHLTGEKEHDLSFGSNVTFQDLETNAKLQLDAPSIQAQYQESFREWISSTKDHFTSKGVDFFPFRINENLSEAINRFTHHRKMLA